MVRFVIFAYSHPPHDCGLCIDPVCLASRIAGQWREAKLAQECIKQVLQVCNTVPGAPSSVPRAPVVPSDITDPNNPFVPSNDYKKMLSFDGEDRDYNGDMPLDKKQLEGPAKKFIEQKLKEAKDEETKLVWLLVQARAELALNTFYLGRKERGEKIEKAKEKGKIYTNRLIPDLENVDLWRLLAMKVQADAAADEITQRAGKNMKIENEKIILRIALFDRKMYGDIPSMISL
jgi:hypothetical protein